LIGRLDGVVVAVSPQHAEPFAWLFDATGDGNTALQNKQRHPFAIPVRRVFAELSA